MRYALALLLALSCAGPAATPHHAARRAAILGDSLAFGAGDERGGGIAKRLPIPAANLAVNGSRTYDVMRRLRATKTTIASSDVVILSIGGNDLYGDSFARFVTLLAPAHAVRRTVDRVDSIVGTIHHLNPTAHVILLGLYDPYARPFLDVEVNRWDAELIARFINEPNVDVIRIEDIFRGGRRLSPIDHFHPGADGYDRIAARIRDSLHVGRASARQPD